VHLLDTVAKEDLMAQRIVEKGILSLTPYGDGTTDLAWSAFVEFIDTVQVDPATGSAPYVVEEVVPVRIPLTIATIADLQAARTAAYKARCAVIFGSAPATSILLSMVAA
jgi:hypothetical protein